MSTPSLIKYMTNVKLGASRVSGGNVTDNFA